MVTPDSIVQRLALALVFVAGCSYTLDPVGSVDGSLSGDAPTARDAQNVQDTPTGTDVVGNDSSMVDVATGGDGTSMDASDAGDVTAIDASEPLDGSLTDTFATDVGMSEIAVMDTFVADAAPDVVPMDTPAADVGMDTGRPDAGVTDTGPMCASPMTICSGTCTNTNTNAANCGSCGNVCQAPSGGSASCLGGVCSSACPSGMSNCSGVCQLTGTACSSAGDVGCQQTGTLVCAGASTACSAMSPRTSGTCAFPVGGSCNSSGSCVCTGATPNNCVGTCTNTASDANNCGGCGRACPLVQSCVAGACVCPSGGTLCGSACINTMTNAANCGGCGNACGSGQVCSAGVCISTCALTLCGTSCTNTSTDAANCGTCGHVCTAPMGGSAICASSTCSGTCPGGSVNCGGVCQVTGVVCASAGDVSCQQSGTTLCSGSSTVCSVTAPRTSGACTSPAGGVCNGSGNCICTGATPNNCSGSCTSTATDANNCGACGHACGSGQSCIGATCCATGDSNCSATCVNLSSDRANCGGCGIACSSTNGTSSCSSSACHITCFSGFADCNGLNSDGCEINTTTSVTNCGACGNACGAGQTCVGGSCTCPASGTMTCGTACCTTATQICTAATSTCATCASPTVPCGPACANTSTDRTNCGGCGTLCASGQVCSAGGCVLPAPRQVAPLSTATVTAQQPTFRWSLPSGVAGAQITLCRNRAMNAECAPFDVPSGSAFVPPTPLAAGMWFWQLHGPAGTMTATSPVWQFVVGQRSAAYDTSWGTLADFNGDGYADVVVGAENVLSATGRAYVHLGGPGGIGTTPTTTLIGPDGAGGNFGAAVESAGDVNGDGFADLVVSATHAASLSGHVYIYLGSASGLVTTSPTVLTGPDGPGENLGVAGFFGSSVSSAGDVNRDGYADVIIGDASVASAAGRAYLYLGSASGLGTTPATVLNAPDGGQFGWSVAGAGDVNADGYGDVVVGANIAGPGTDTGQAYIYLGGPGAFSTTPATTMTGPNTPSPGSVFGDTVACAGDVNADGYADVLIGANCESGYTGWAYVYLGSSGGIPMSPATSLEGPDGDNGQFGISLSGAGDVNGDGYADIIIGAMYAPWTGVSGPGRVYVFHGGGGGIVSTPATSLYGSNGSGADFGTSVAGAGDVNGDGFADVLVGEDCGIITSASCSPGNAYVFAGGTSGTATSATPTLPGPDGNNGHFGTSVARANRVSGNHRQSKGTRRVTADVH